LKARKQTVIATQTLKESPVYLIRRDGRYSYRRRIPEDLIEHYGRKFITKALGTADRREAERLARALSVEHDNEFDALRADQQQAARGQMPDAGSQFSVIPNSPATQPKQPPPMPYLPAQLRGPLSGDREGEALAILAKLRRKRAVAEEAGPDELKDFMVMTRFARSFDEMVLSGDEESSKPLWWHEASLTAHKAFFDGAGQSGISLLLKAPPAAHTQAVQPSEGAGEQTTLDQLVELWRKDGSQTNVRTLEKVALVVRRFKECIGNLPVQAITRRHCVEFRDKLRNLKATSGKPLSVATVNDNMDKLRALLAVAKRRSLIEQNPAEDLSLTDPVRAIDKRQPFDSHALVRIFSSRIYTEGFRPDGGKGEAAHWLPLLALFTGARLEELGQLRPEDVRQEEYENADGATVSVWVIHLTEEGEGQGLKNAKSIRRVPLHSELTRLGFVEFVASRRGRARVFYELKKDTRDRETGNWSKWFGRWLRKECAVADTRMVFHSFRHTLKDLCRIARIPTEDSNALTGHSGATVAEKYGGSLYPLEPLADGIKKIRLPVAVQGVLNTLPKYRA